jgi:predicted nucleic acid-binding protein
VPTLYIDTSALGRVLLGESDRAAILRAMGAFDLLVASRLLRIELRRLALRHGLLGDADQLLAGVGLSPLDDAVLTMAETTPPATVATLDAIHLTTALRLADAGALDAVMTYDVRLSDGARQHGLTVLAPA